MQSASWWAIGGGAAVFVGSLLPWVSVYVFDSNLFKAVEVGNSISGRARAASAVFGVILIGLAIAIQSASARGVFAKSRAYAYGIPLIALSVLGIVGCGIFAVVGEQGFREADGPWIVGYGIFTLTEKRPVLAEDGTAGSAHVSFTPNVGLIMILLGCTAVVIGAIWSLHCASPRPRRARHRGTHTFHLRPVKHGFVGGLCVAMGAFFLAFPVYGLFSPGFYKGSSALETAGTLLLGVLVALVCAWMGVRQFRNGAKVSGRKLTIRNEIRTYTVDAADIGAITLQPKSSPNGDYWVARVELTSGKSIWIDNFDCGPAGKPPKPGRATAVEEVRTFLGVRADDIRQPGSQPRLAAQGAEAERILSGMVAEGVDPDYVLPEMIRQDRKATAVTGSEDGPDETQARISHREAIIRKSLGWINAILWLFLIIAIPDPASGETDQGLPAWLWWGIGMAGVMLALTVLAFKTNVPRRIAEIITANRNEFDVQ